MALKDLSSYLDDDAISFPLDGKTYRIESPDAKTGLLLSSMVNLGVKASTGGEIDDADLASLDLDGAKERDFMRMVLGDTLDELVADEVSWVKIQRISRYAFLYFAVGEDTADEALKSGALSGEASAPNRAKRRAASRGGATSTKRLASTAGTTSPPKRKPKPKVAS